jgi:uncharacterized membrane protein
MHKRILWITRAGILVALLVILQAATIPLGNNIVTGIIVNMMLIISVMTCGLTAGLAVGAVSPVLPTLLGFGPTWPLIPFIAAGNMVLVLLWHIIGNRNIGKKYTAQIIAAPIAAIAKFTVLYSGIVRIAVPYILNLPEQQAKVMSYLFSYPQIITATAGGVCAAILLPILKKAIQVPPGDEI